jgi:Tol biopolymer transport system component
MTDGSGMDRFGSWSPDGNTLYYISERDGFRCIAARRSMVHFIDANWARLSLSSDKVVFSLAERAGNIWMAELGERR